MQVYRAPCTSFISVDVTSCMRSLCECSRSQGVKKNLEGMFVCELCACIALAALHLWPLPMHACAFASEQRACMCMCYVLWPQGAVFIITRFLYAVVARGSSHACSTRKYMAVMHDVNEWSCSVGSINLLEHICWGYWVFGQFCLKKTSSESRQAHESQSLAHCNHV